MIPPVARNLVRIMLTRIGDSLIVDIERGNYELACIIDCFTLMLVSYLICRSSEILHYLFSKRIAQHDPARRERRNIPIHSMRSKHIIWAKKSYMDFVCVWWD
jgi:hypothetical protein